MLLERLLAVLILEDLPAKGSLGDMIVAVTSRPSSWLIFAIATAAIWLCMTSINVIRLYRRARELRSRFRDTLPRS